MSKMRTPEMEVVRFKEADVIVASAPTTMTASGWGDGTNGNFKINYGGTEYGYSNRRDLTAELTQNGQTDDVFTSAGRSYTFNQLFGAEHSSDTDTRSLTGFDWDSANNRWNTRTQ